MRKLHLLVFFGIVFLLAACGQPQSDRSEPSPTAGSSPLGPAEVLPATSEPNNEIIPATGTESAYPPPASVEDPAPAVDCTAPAGLTPTMAEGPYYKPNSPERTSLLEPGMPGTRLFLTGYVLNQDCQPISGAWLDFWQTGADGAYDNAGYGLRGYQLTDAQGRYQLETVVPGLYPGRTAHIHVKVQAPGGPVLTTQLFIPGAAGNQTDRIFSEQLLMDMQNLEGGLLAEFDFVIEP